MSRFYLFTLLLVFLSLCIIVDSKRVLHGELDVVPSSWRHHSSAPSHTLVTLDILLKYSNATIQQLEELLYDVSHPSSDNYGNYYTIDELSALLPVDGHSAVLSWLTAHGVPMEHIQYNRKSSFISCQIQLKNLEKLLHTTYSYYQHKDHENLIVLRTLKYYLPSHIADLIDIIGPTIRFNNLVHHPISPSKFTEVSSSIDNNNDELMQTPHDNPCEYATTPACLKQTYLINNYVAQSPESTICVTGYLGQFVAPSDLALFFATFDKNDTRNASIVGPNDPTQPGTEASLDIQYSMGVASGTQATFWYTAGSQPNNSQNEPFLVFLQAIDQDSNAPWVISTSYGDDEPTVDFNYASRMNVEFIRLGLRGISVLFSSGDGGVSGGQSQQCTTFIPTYPAGSPYVTSVGATTQFQPEVAASFSSGGFTNYWSAPSYQQQAIATYMSVASSTLPPSNLWNATGRGFPDVSAQGTNFPVFTGGFPMPVDGTSCSSPTFAAVVALLNDVRFQVGKSSLGFLNPLFYQNSQVFNDVTSGSNPGCNTNGFTATQGWDPVTGLGTPNFQKLATLVKNLP